MAWAGNRPREEWLQKHVDAEQMTAVDERVVETKQRDGRRSAMGDVASIAATWR